jgi:hypothetical protein
MIDWIVSGYYALCRFWATTEADVLVARNLANPPAEDEKRGGHDPGHVVALQGAVRQEG